MGSVVIIIPAYQEAGAIGAVLDSLIPTGFSIIVIDDGSADDTAAVAARYPVRVISHPINLGQGAAIQTGFEAALQQGPDIIITFDADGQHSVNDLAALLQPIREGRADVVFGSRFQGTAANMPPLRRFLVAGFTGIFSVLTGIRISDTHCGLRAFSRTAAQQMQLRQNRMAHTLEIIETVGRSGLRFVEVPVHITYSEYSLNKGQRTRDGLAILFDWIVKKC